MRGMGSVTEPSTPSETVKSSANGGDPLLPQVLQGSILVTQTLVNLSLREIRLQDERKRKGKERERDVDEESLVGLMRIGMHGEHGFLEGLIGAPRSCVPIRFSRI